MRIAVLFALLFVFCIPAVASAQEIVLPTPSQSGGKPLFDAIKQRQSTRDIAETALDNQTLSDLLWVAYGFNRDGMRVVPSALNKQELDVYVFLKEGVYRYDARTNRLILQAAGDHRAKAGRQDYVATAPVNLVYVADRSQETGTGAYISCGCAVQNVYLACASKGLGCRVRTSIDKDVLHEVLKLDANREPLAGQTIGFRKDAPATPLPTPAAAVPAPPGLETLLAGNYLGYEGDDRIGLVVQPKVGDAFPVVFYEDGLPGRGHRPDDDDRYEGTARLVGERLEIELTKKIDDGRKEERVETALRRLTASVARSGEKITLSIPANRQWDAVRVEKVP